jgi:hypothetical protein
VVAQNMGHTKVDTTMNVYTQVLDGAARAAADRVRARPDPNCSELFRSRMERRRQLIEKDWLAALDEFRNWLMREAA